LIQPCHGNFQFFVLDTKTREADADLPVVVSLGSNYCQGPHTLPSPLTGSQVEAKLGSAHGYLDKLFVRLANSPATIKPIDFRSARFGPSFAAPRGDFHLVMTNFCPWITTRSWGPLLKDYPGPMTDLIGSWQWPAHRPAVASNTPTWRTHLHALITALPPETCWMGHGGVHVSKEFDQFIDRFTPKNWGFTRNLGSRWSQF